MTLRGLITGRLISYLPARVGFKSRSAAILADEETVGKKTGRTMISANRCNNGVRAFFYPIANVVGGQNNRFKKRSGRFGWSLTPFGADLWLRFLTVLTCRSGRGRFGWSLTPLGADPWLRFLRVLTWRSGRGGQMGKLFPAS